jgi:hypothetical protein
MALENWKKNCETMLEILVKNVVCHAKTHFCVNFGCIIMKESMNVVIPFSSGLKAKISHT